MMYMLGIAPWERRDVVESWKPLLEGPDALAPGRALDVGCGSGRDAVHLANQGWQVTAVDFVDKALEKARKRAADESVEVQWVKGDVGGLGELGLDPGYTLLYDNGCMHGLPDDAARGAAAGLGKLAAPGATLLIVAFKRARRRLLPHGIDDHELVALLGEGWDLVDKRAIPTDDMPPPVRKAEPTRYRFTRRA